MKKFLFAAIVAIGTLVTGCSDNNPGDREDYENGILKVTIQGENAPAGRAMGSPTQMLENTVKSFTVYVFNHANGMLEKSQSFNSGLTGTLTGLSTAFTKKVVVAVNLPAGYPTVTHYSDFDTHMLNLDTQDPVNLSADGLFMSGEAAPVTVSASTPPLVIQVSRIVSKVRLGSLTVDPDAGLLLNKFILAGVSIQKARDYSPLLGNLAASGFNYVGGTEGNVSSSGDTPKPYLHETYSLAGDYQAGNQLPTNIYFYVFPNNNTNGNATLLTLYGTYDGVQMYYPFYINDKVNNSDGNSTDGTYITRNNVYTLHIALKKLGTGANNPDTPNEQVSMDVTVDVQDWYNELVQYVEW